MTFEATGVMPLEIYIYITFGITTITIFIFIKKTVHIFFKQ